MAVLAIKSEPKCKLCNHPARPEIDLLLEKRSKGEKTSDGQRVTGTYVLVRLSEWGVEHPTKDNIARHWRNHCELVTEEEAATVSAELSEHNAEMLAIVDASDGTVDGDIEAIRRLGLKRIRAKLLRGEDPGVTVDHSLKAAAEQTKRSQNEAARELLGTLAGGLARALTQPKPLKQIEGAEVIVVDAEAIEETAE